MSAPVDVVFARAARRSLVERDVTGRAPIAASVSSIVATGEAMTRELPPVGRASIGVRVSLGLFRRCLGLHRAMVHAGVSPTQADEVVQDLMWRLAAPMVRASYATTRMSGADRTRRAALANRAAWTVVFRAPFRQQPRADRGPVAFDVHRCPFADWFAAVGEPGFTAVVACSLDSRLAQVWQRELVRPTTIAAGHDRCEFTFTPVSLRSG